MRTIIIGGGNSVAEGISKGLWDKIKGKEIWSLNSVYKVMPYLPTKQIWVDIEFFNHEVANLQKLYDQGVKLVCKNHNRFAALKDYIEVYPVSRERERYWGKQAIEKNEIFYGFMGLSGTFALSYAIAKGYKEIFLLGYDFGTKSLEDKNTHFYQDQIAQLNIVSSGATRPEVYLLPKNEINPQIEDYGVFLKEEDVKIYNVSMHSNIDYFQKITYERFFDYVH